MMAFAGVAEVAQRDTMSEKGKKWLVLFSQLKNIETPML